MVDRPANTPLLVVMSPYKFTEFHYTKLELNYFPPYCEVAVWDISQLINRNFSDAIASERSQRPNVVVVAKWTDFIRRVLELRLQYTTSQLYVAGDIPNANGPEFLTSLIVKYLRRKQNVTFIERSNGGIPLYYPVASTGGTPSSQQPSKLSNIRMFFTTLSTFTELMIRLQYSFFRALARWLPSATTYRLVAGEHYKVPALRQYPRTATLVLSHSDDYSKYLVHTAKKPRTAPRNTKLAVLLEASGPMFASDFIQTGATTHVTSSEWYPALTKFLHQLESSTGVMVEIASHYKSAHPPTPEYYGQRNVRVGMTLELVRNSKFVITRQSTAISYAVLYRKPVILICSHQSLLETSESRLESILASFLGVTPVNIDQPPWNFEQLLQVDESRYQAYEKACLTSAGPPRPNSQIILEDIMRITVCPGHYNHPL